MKARTFERLWIATGQHQTRMTLTQSTRSNHDDAVLEYPQSGERIRGRRGVGHDKLLILQNFVRPPLGTISKTRFSSDADRIIAAGNDR